MSFKEGKFCEIDIETSAGDIVSMPGLLNPHPDLADQGIQILQPTSTGYNFLDTIRKLVVGYGLPHTEFWLVPGRVVGKGFYQGEPPKHIDASALAMYEKGSSWIGLEQFLLSLSSDMLRHEITRLEKEPGLNIQLILSRIHVKNSDSSDKAKSPIDLFPPDIAYLNYIRSVQNELRTGRWRTVNYGLIYNSDPINIADQSIDTGMSLYRNKFIALRMIGTMLDDALQSNSHAQDTIDKTCRSLCNAIAGKIRITSLEVAIREYEKSPIATAHIRNELRGERYLSERAHYELSKTIGSNGISYLDQAHSYLGANGIDIII